MDELLTITQIAKRSGLPETTIRRYLNLFQSFVKVRRFSRTKKYTVEAVDLVQSIAAMYAAGKETQEITALLRANVPQIVEVQEPRESDLITVKYVRSISTMLESQVGVISTLQVDLDAMMGEMETSEARRKEESEALIEEIRALRAQVNDLQNQLNEKPKSSFWSKLIEIMKKPNENIMP